MEERRVVSIVDDDASLRRSVGNLLRSEGFEVETFDSAEGFLASADRARARCLLLDLRMPGMGGLDLLSRLATSGSRDPVIVLTAHGSDEVRRRCLEAGAFAFLEKPFESETLFDALRRAMPTGAKRSGSKVTSQPVDFACGTLDEHRHVCAFFSSADEEHRVLRSFIRDGFDAGDKAFHIVAPDLRDDHLRRLAEAGIDVERALATGQLEVAVWEEAHLCGDRFEMDAMLELVDRVLQDNRAAGYPQTRIVAHMEWALLDRPGVDDLLEYEARVHKVLTKYHDPVICTYDLSRFGAAVAIDVMRTHPMVIIGGVLQENPFFVPPDEFIAELRERGVAREGSPAAG